MAIVRNIDVTMQSEISFDDACRAAVAEAAKTLRGIMSFRVKEAECVVEHDKIIAYRVTGEIVFLFSGDRPKSDTPCFLMRFDDLVRAHRHLRGWRNTEGHC